MSQQPVSPRLGSATAQELYMAVGVALSWWEGTEDVLMGIFRDLCAKKEPTAFQSYVESSRAVRQRMIKFAFKRYPQYFTPDEEAAIRDAMGQLNALAPIRNQIAHGHTVSYNSKRNGSVAMSGNFLMPSLNERGHQVAPDPRYALTATEMNEWTEKVRAQRARILDASEAALIRLQEARQALSSDGQMTLSVAEAIVEGRARPEDFSFVSKPRS